MDENDLVLNGRYKLTKRVLMRGLVSSHLWEASDKDGEIHTLKISPFAGEKPSPEIRRLWDNDLRLMYRLSSSAGADEQLVVMKDAGIDLDARATVLVYEGWNHCSFAQMVQDRDRLDWISFRTLRDPSARGELWRALLRLANGLQLLHDQYLIHRNVSLESIWGRQGEGTESLRLSGFDWSARLGYAATTSAAAIWSTPPELDRVGYSFSSDWYGLGTTIARCFFRVEHLASSAPKDMADGITAIATRENPCQLSELEKGFIRSMVASRREDRMNRPSSILAGMQGIVDALAYGLQTRGTRRSVLLHLDCRAAKNIEALEDWGFFVDDANPFETFNSELPLHRARLKEFLAGRMRTARLAWKRNQSQLEISCGSRFFVCDRWMDSSTREQSWAAAKTRTINRTSVLRDPVPATAFADALVDIELNLKEVYSKLDASAEYMSWDVFAPRAETIRRLGRDSEHLRQFLHASNQFEILLCDAQLFRYKVVHEGGDREFTKIGICGFDEYRPSRRFFKANEKLVDFLQQELDSGKKDCDKVLLTNSDALFVSRARSSMFSERFDVDDEQWKISEIDHENEIVFLSRRKLSHIEAAPKVGYIRTRGHYGQTRLIERRKESIDRLTSHAYLLRAMLTPTLTRLDAGEAALPLPEIENNDAIDKNKIAIIKDVLRLRPIYGLQGPPGTGKSTLLAHELRQILVDDPMAQILVTAKDHDAIDVLRAKVRSEAYKDEPDERVPIAVRLSRRDDRDHASELVMEYAQNALRMLNANSPLMETEAHHEIQRRWSEILQGLLTYADARNSEQEIGEQLAVYQRMFKAFRDLVRRGASITYCTTSSGDLEELAKGSHSFDWSIIEEAGKTHGFDLALPLQAGHRWLLLGDHKQLRPFLYDEFVDCFDRVEDAVSVLDELRQKKGNDRLVDIEWLKARLDADTNSDGAWTKSFKAFGHVWLATFATVFEKLTTIRGIEEITGFDSRGYSAGLLTTQYRMPPVCGDLISKVFYNGKIRNGTADAAGAPLSDHQNPFEQPAWLAGESLVWLDTPWVHEFRNYRKTGYSNKRERQEIQKFLRSVVMPEKDAPSKPCTVAILTPYNLQKYEINNAEFTAPVGCVFGSSQDRSESGGVAYSVDSFQGNQADIVIVSLVRNELKTARGQASASDIKFIAQPDRLNVMLSRSVRLQVVVGCWDYLSACVADVSSARNEQGEYVDREYGPFKRTLEIFEEFFKEGRAVRISVGRHVKGAPR